MAEKQAIYDPVMVKYIQDVIAELGTVTEEKVIDGQKVAITTKVKQVKDDVHKVKTITRIDNEKKSEQVFKITSNPDGTYNMINRNLDIDETFTDKLPEGVVVGSGSGQSSPNGARINLYDKEYGTPHTLTLYDNYSACATLNQGVFQAPVRPNTVDVTWEASPFYLHWCFVPHEFDHGKIQYGTTVYNLDGHGDRRGSHAFTNHSAGTTWYSVEANFVYGTW